jgi:uncharacterized protein YodC (DUF2158 family)
MGSVGGGPAPGRGAHTESSFGRLGLRWLCVFLMHDGRAEFCSVYCGYTFCFSHRIQNQQLSAAYYCKWYKSYSSQSCTCSQQRSNQHRPARARRERLVIFIKIFNF